MMSGAESQQPEQRLRRAWLPEISLANMNTSFLVLVLPSPLTLVRQDGLTPILVSEDFDLCCQTNILRCYLIQYGVLLFRIAPLASCLLLS